MKNRIGQKIKKIRASKGFTQENMAFELGITKGAYSKIETGGVNVSIDRIYEIAEILEVEVLDFFKEGSGKNTEDPSSKYGFATKHDIDELVKMIQQLASELQTVKIALGNKEPLSKKKTSRKK